MTTCNQSLVDGWRFRKLGVGEALKEVCIPHSPFVSDLDGQDHWHGHCEYRRQLQLSDAKPNERYVLAFGAAMHTAKVFIDEELAGTHIGGYLPFEIDVSRWLRDGAAHELRVVLENGNAPDVPPGKPIEELDFCYYGGLYREVELRTYPQIYITDPVSAGTVGSGGVFVRTESLDDSRAILNLSVHIQNDGRESTEYSIRYSIYDYEGNRVASNLEQGYEVGPENSTTSRFTLEIVRPIVWSVGEPRLHKVVFEVLNESGQMLDRREERFGIRWIEVSRKGGMLLNGKRIRPRGTNRHQDYPRVGYALSNAAQYRDAKRIKEAGFDYVRLSHYPQSPAFLDACDELGILVMNCIPGWQYIGGSSFKKECYQNAQDLIRRDRNHPCVIFWELSLNETEMDEAFMDRMQEIGHEEYPGSQMLVCGWIDKFDVFIHSRQHGMIHSWENGEKALVVAEYGDWEFYASNEGFDQKTGAGLLEEWKNSRAFRGAGERRLRQQALNHIIALNDTLSSPAVADGLWSMYDYPRGYHPTRAACGVMDIHRLPKYSYFFYRSQRSPHETSHLWSGGPMVYIASRWFENSVLDILVFSNCESVTLALNGEACTPVEGEEHFPFESLPYPPFVFRLGSFVPGCLEALGFIGGKQVAQHSVMTPGSPSSIALSVEDEGVRGELDELDILLGHARVRDENGQLSKFSSIPVHFRIVGEAEIVGSSEVQAESGIASIVIRRFPQCRRFKLFAENADVGNCEYVYEVIGDTGDFVPNKAETI